MSLEKIGNFFCVTENNTSSGISGDGVTEPIGLDSNVYPEYNETCLFSSVYSCQTGNLSDSFAKYQRLRLRVGWHNNSTTTNESDSYLEVTPSPEIGSNVAAIWSVGTGTPGYICVGRINFPTLSSFNGTYGKLCDMNSNTSVTGWEGKLRPIKEIWGINKKPPHKLTILPSEHGSAQASVLTGYVYDEVTLSNTPDTDWYFSGYNITGATLTGNKFVFGDSDVTAQAVFADTPQIKTLTLQTDGHGTLTANKVTGFEGDTVTLTPTYNDYYRFSTYQTTGGTINGNTYTFGTAQEQTAKANFTANKFTITGNYNYGQVTYTASWDAKVRSIVGNGVPTSWGTVGNNFNPGSCSAYGFTYKTTVNGWYERGSSRLQLYHYIGSTRTKSAGVEGYNGYNNYTNSCTLTGTSTLTGHPKLSAWISCSYNKHTNGMPTNGWTATGYIK